jgi:hypothetical protein
MLRAYRLPAARISLLIVSVVLVSAFVASTDPSRALASSFVPETAFSLSATGVSAPVEQRVSKPRRNRRRSPPARLTECVAAAGAGKQRKARKACAVKKAKAKGSQPSIASARWSLVRAISPVEPVALVEPAAPAEPVVPVEQTPPAALTPLPIEPTPPVESSPPVEPAPPVEPVVPVEPTPPVAPAPPVEEPTPPMEPAAPIEPAAPFRFFSPTSFWNEALPADAPLDPSSAGVVGAFDEEIASEEAAKKGAANINTTAWSVPVYTVPADQPTVKVTLVASRVSLSPALQTAWEAVPLPPEAKPAAGTDRDLVVWQPSTDKLWEFWGLEKTEAGWLAKWGGAIEKDSSDSGAYGPEAWPGAKSNWGASACSLSIAGGLITLEDLERGEINHALAIAIPNTRAGEYASPAQRTDGYSTAPLSLPEGAHLRLDPNLDLASLHLPRLTLMMAEAAQRYGIFVRDSAVNVAFVAQDPTPTGANPYTGAHGYFEGKSPQQLLASFPWSHLQLLKMNLHRTS